MASNDESAVNYRVFTTSSLHLAIKAKVSVPPVSVAVRAISAGIIVIFDADSNVVKAIMVDVDLVVKSESGVANFQGNS